MIIGRSSKLFLSLLALCAGLTACGATSEDDDDATGGNVEFSALYTDYFQGCVSCHTPDGPGRTSDTEQTLDFTSADTAESRIKTGVASGLQGNQTGCNGMPFIGTSPENSLIVAVVDETVRANFVAPSDHPDCDVDAIADMTVKVGSQPSAAFIANLKQWVSQQSSAVSRVER